METALFSENDTIMKRVLKWHKLGSVLTALIYLLSFLFVGVYFLHMLKPELINCHVISLGLFCATSVVLAIRVISAIVTKVNICRWQHKTHNKLTYKEIIKLI
jgi:hypothetical protein